MLADEVTHVKMGSDWLRRLTEKDPERRERALEFQRTVDKIFSLGGFRGESEENPIQLARRFRELAGFTDDESRRDRRDRASGPGRGGGDVAGGAGRGLTMGRVHVTPDPFTVVPYEVPVIVGLVEEAAALIGFPTDVEIDLEVDEDLPHPLVGTASDVVDGRAVLWMSGGNLEDTHRNRAVLGAVGAARARRRCCCARTTGSPTGFASAPPDVELTLAERGRVGRVDARAAPDGSASRSRPDRMRYDFRLQHGFTDAADAAFDRLWDAETLTWDGLREICKETGAADRPPRRSRPISCGASNDRPPRGSQALVLHLLPMRHGRGTRDGLWPGQRRSWALIVS